MKKTLSIILIALIAGSLFADGLSLSDQGFFSVGGRVITTEGVFDPINGQYNPAGQSLHADAASVFYQKPTSDNGHAMVFLHGYGQSRLGWMGSPDGRDGWNDYFLRKGYSTYLMDQARRGEASQSSESITINPSTMDQAWYTQFRMGLCPSLNDGSKFPRDEESMRQFFYQMTPDTGSIDFSLIANSIRETMEKSGKGILVTHSQGGFPGWDAMALTDKIEAVIAIEPGAVPFPHDSLPTPVDTGYYTVGGYEVSDEEFQKIISKPIIVIYGDYISLDSQVPAERFWAVGLENARAFASLANSRGGDVTVVYLPEVGIYGNSHFMFQEENNMEIADYIYSWLSDRGLD